MPRDKGTTFQFSPSSLVRVMMWCGWLWLVTSRCTCLPLIAETRGAPNPNNTIPLIALDTPFQHAPSSISHSVKVFGFPL